MNVAALYCIHGPERWLRYSFQSIYPAVSRIYFLISSRRWYGPPGDNAPLLRDIAALPDAEGKIRLQPGDWQAETDQRNFSLALAQVDGFDYGMIVDADEVYDTDQLAAAFALAAAEPKVECWHIRWFTYWKSLRFRIDPIESYDPPMLVRLGTCGFRETRNILGNCHALIPPPICMCHHLSYARSDEEIREKHIFFPGHAQSMRPQWFEEVWRAWDANPAMEQLHPVTPPQFLRAVPQPIGLVPPVLREALARGD